MITDKDKRTIQEIARKYQASRVLLFGSALSDSVESHDIDIAVDGIPDKDFYSFYGELMFALSKPVDVVDLSEKSKFIDLVLKEGIPIDAWNRLF
ncbi:MAG: nucleotidyltransferase domain-containing protein [Candidatus Riflebacteria bacterium]|nr:nucleotidyltransferase domain-containing protein [Candidatus Riflebacteria bacterium]